MPKTLNKIHNRRENAFKTTEAIHFKTHAKLLTWHHSYAIYHSFKDKCQITINFFMCKMI